jgi:hypothetical protein
MEHIELEGMIEEIKRLKERMDHQITKKLQLDLLSRIIIRLGSFHIECDVCQKTLIELKEQLNLIKVNQGQLSKTEMKEYFRKINNTVAHLQKQHKLVSEGYYMGICMALGVSFGLLFGTVLYSVSAIGVSIGMCFGLAIGNGLDADAKKKGKTI